MDGVIYIDILYLINFILDMAALWATARIMSVRPRMWRLLFASVSGALVSVAALYLSRQYIIVLFIFIGIMLAALHILLPKKNMLFIIKAFGVYLLIAFAMAGAALGGKTILSDNMLQSSWRVLIFAFAAALIFACYGMGKLVRNWQRSSFCRPMRIIINSKAVTVDALIDTGNDLREPVSQRPAVIAELHALSALFPQQIFAMLEQYASKEPHKVIELCGNELWRRRFCLLPYNSIGGSGILLGVRPDMVMIEGDEEVYTDEVIICFYGGHIAADNSARAIINPAVLTLPNIFETKRVS